MPLFGSFGSNSDDAEAPSALVDAFSDTAKVKFTKKEAPPEVPRKRPAEDASAPASTEKSKKPRKPKKPKTGDSEAASEVSGEASEQREVFVGNLPLSTKKPDLEKLFRKFGTVESVRFRSLPVAGTAVDEAGNDKLMKKVCAIKGKFSDAKDSSNAYGESPSQMPFHCANPLH
jgi:RNA recognition motif-containing protein